MQKHLVQDSESKREQDSVDMDDVESEEIDVESKRFQRVPYPEHPNRCQAMAANNQCMNMAVEGVTCCFAHGGHSHRKQLETKNIHNYLLGKWQARVNQMSGSPTIKSLRDEIGILRMLLEQVINKCEDETTLLLASGKISDLIIKIEKLVTSCHKIENQLGETLDKTVLLQFALRVIEIISNNVKDEITINAIADQIIIAANSGKDINESIPGNTSNNSI